MRASKNRGYYVSRQTYAHGDPCTHAIEIAYSTDEYAPNEHASPTEMAYHYSEEGLHDYPLQAVRAAIKLQAKWRKKLGTAVRLTVITGGGAYPPQVMTQTALRAWAKKRYNGLPKMPKATKKPTPKERCLVCRFDHLLANELAVMHVEPSPILPDVSKMSEEEGEEYLDRIDQEGGLFDGWIAIRPSEAAPWTAQTMRSDRFFSTFTSHGKDYFEMVKEALEAYDGLVKELVHEALEAQTRPEAP